MNATHTTRELRTTKGIEHRAAAADEAGIVGTLSGYAAKFGVDSSPMTDAKHKTPFIERIAPGAFTRTLADKSAKFMLWQHDENHPLAREGVNLTLEEDAVGLKFTAKLQDTAQARDLYTNVKAGVVDSNSFAFTVAPGGEVWTRENGVDVRTITEARLYEVSPVVFPAYPDTTLAARMQERFHAALAATPELRNYVPSAQDEAWRDSTLTAHHAFAREMQGLEQCRLDAGNKYLRSCPAGEHAEYARAAVKDSGANLRSLISWVVKNGDVVNDPDAPDINTRATPAISAALARSRLI